MTDVCRVDLVSKPAEKQPVGVLVLFCELDRKRKLK